MGAWARSLGGKNLTFLADGSAEFAKAIGLSLDLTSKGLGVRNQRYALVADDGVVKYIGIGDLEVTGVDAVLKALETVDSPPAESQ